MKKELLLVGETAKKLGVSVRTLQYYDKIGLVIPSLSEGGRRLCSDKDIVKIHQVMTLKYFGFSLAKIKEKLLLLDSTDDVIIALEAQERQVSEQIKSLTEVQKVIKVLKKEIKEMNEVNWYKYAGIIEVLRTRGDYYWVVKHFEEKTFMAAASKYDIESSKKFVNNLENIWDRAIALIDAGEDEGSEKAQILAKEWWDMITEFTGGDMTILQDLMKFAENVDSWQNEEWKEKWQKTQDFLSNSLAVYFEKNQMEVDI